jgi:6-phosphogluconolactonase (cycloisomerase 2 family)
VLTVALSSAIVFSLTSCIRSFTVGYLYVTGTVTATPSGNGIITGFKINNDNGKLTPINGTPVASGGANPVRAVLLSGGNFVYVLNAGATTGGSSVCTATDTCPTANISEFEVGGNGILTYQQFFSSQGYNPFRLISDSTGAYIFVLDAIAPGTVNPNAPSNALTGPLANPNSYCQTYFGTPSCGDITVFSISSTTGRLSLVPNAQLSTSSNTQVTYFPVPANPIDFNMASGYLMTLAGAPSSSPSAVITNAAAGQTVYPYSYNASNGQLGVSQSTQQFITNGAGLPVGQATAINFSGGHVYILDNEPLVASGTPGQILPFTVGTNGALQALVGGAVADDPTQTDPIQLMVESKGRFLFVANSQGASISNGAGIVGYTIDPTSSQLTESPGSPFLLENTGSGSPNGTGAQPVCILEDPSNQYIFTANAGDSTVTGKVLDPNSGALTQMKGSTGTFSINGPASWCWVTGRTN